MSNGLLYSADYNWMTHEVRLLDKSGNVILRFSPDVVTDDITKPLTFIAKQGNPKIALRVEKYAISNKYEYMRSARYGVWVPYTLGSAIALKQGEAVSFRISARNMAQDSGHYVSFTASDGVIEAWNNVQSMVDVGDYTITVPEYGLYHLFYGCSSLIRAPKLPATTLTNSCYNGMFLGCTALVQAPELPATTLAKSCYHSMFHGCEALTQVPSLPAMGLEEDCYSFMFFGCTSLVQAPALPATTLAKKCYQSMFRGCSSLIYAPPLPAMELEEGCYESMFNACVSLVQAPSALPAIDAEPRCYFSMFEGCASLINAPTIAATACRINSDKYDNAHLSYMFRNCTALVNPPEIHLTTLAYHALYFMFAGCTSLIRAPHLPAITLAEGCYYGIFKGCSSLTEASIAATTTATEALMEWLANVAASGTVYADPNFTDLPTNSPNGIPQNWTRLNIDDYPQT